MIAVEKIKMFFTSERGMNVVNILFILAMFIRNSGVIVIAYLFWILYLVYCTKHTSSKITAAVYKVFIAFAAVMILANVYFILR